MAADVKGRRTRGRSRISAKNQVTLPVAALRGSGLGTGDVVEVEATGRGRMILRRVDDPIEKLAGSFRYPKGYLAKLRSEWRG